LLPRIESLTIDDHILEKIEVKHGIVFEEVEEICFSDRIHVRRSSKNLYKLFGQTVPGRYVLVVLIHIEGGLWKVVTARDMTESEKHLYTKKSGD
jgi:uncharacterized DUF497 family protein